MIIPTLPVATIAAVVEGAASHPRPDHRFTYGTAGFRMNAQLLDSVMFRVGLLAALRSMCLEGKTVGVMVTASHNPAQDNGVKLVEPLGEMLDQEWEVYAMDLANAATDDALVAAMQAIVDTQTIGLRHTAAVVVARDTRPSGAALVDSLMHGIRSMGGFVTDFGLMTTPQLHYVTRCINTAGTPEAYGEPTAQGYYSKLANSFTAITKGTTLLSTLHVDCANGIGAPALREFLQVLGDDHFKVEIVNGDTANSEKLNYNCGADFVKLHQKAPEGLTMVPGQRWCSYDGDADRIVFYYCDINGRFKLLDGDKIATLAAEFIMGLIRTANVVHIDGSPLKAGLVQTAYANGSSTSYVKDTLKVPVVFTPTGVKHLHHAAEHFDVGVYFEANGHGTVLFSKQAIQRFNATDGPTRIFRVDKKKVKVQDRTLFVPINADTELSEPAGLQDRINQQTTKFAKGRCFVRPSGTEDIVRVYAEAATTEETEMLANVVCGIVFDDYGGIGERPAKYLKVGATETITH
ncbi:hypothetical protein BASA60_009990 [Batrachochytrium salamandrivorans]|nr:hypothetical protein BASA60_009990 [Batrachochytrium salamandrivorans]